MSHSNFPNQTRAVVSLALLYAFRMLGLFMVLPVLALYGRDYLHQTPALLGLALGVYGASQALLQIPFGLWSDRWGRKPVIAIGLLLFALGSVVAALADSVYGLILGRFLQGGGAIASVIMALVADLTTDRNRTKAMAGIGASIGLTFAVAFILGPVVTGFGGLPAVFWLTAALALAGLGILFWVVPSPRGRAVHSLHTKRSVMTSILRQPNLLRLDFGIFTLHFVLMASFVVLPTLLESVLELPGQRHGWLYLKLLGGSFLVMAPFMMLAERKRRIRPVFLAAVALLGLMQLWLAWGYQSRNSLLAGLFLFFVAFNLLEATLPSLLSKFAPAGTRGAANGVYSTSQFAGAFLGGVLGGLVSGWSGPGAVFLLGAAVTACWLLASWWMPAPRQLAEVQVALTGRDHRAILPQLLQLPGVAEVWYEESSQAAHLRVDRDSFRRDSIAALGLG